MHIFRNNWGKEALPSTRDDVGEDAVDLLEAALDFPLDDRVEVGLEASELHSRVGFFEIAVGTSWLHIVDGCPPTLTVGLSVISMPILWQGISTNPALSLVGVEETGTGPFALQVSIAHLISAICA